jgi:general secretion pathway protein D
LILICPPGLVDQWLALIASADQREPVERRTYTPGSFPARDVANLIEQTVRSGPTSSVSALAGPTSTSASTTTSSPLGADDRWKLIIDDLTGTLIITATAAQHDQIAELLDRLAAIPAEARRAVRSFKLRNRPVKEVQQVVEDLLRAGVLQAQAAGDSNSPTPGPAFRGSGVPPASPQSSARPFTPGSAPADSPAGTFPLAPNAARAAPRPSGPASPLTLTSDEATNTLIAVVNGSEPRLLAQLEQLLPTLDIRQPQVMLEATLVSLSDSESISLGAELERIQLSGDTLIKLSSLFGLSAAAGAGSALTRTVGDGAGFTGAVLNPGDFSVVLRALQTVNHGRSLSNPKLLVNNNQQASFNSVLQQPFSSTNASSTVSTTSFGGTQDAGTTISIKPQIAEGDHLVLTYSVSLSSFVGAAANANLPPPRQQNSVQSVATIPDGYTVVVGGLELLTSGKGVSQIPFLADIPFIGEAFKNRANDSGRQRFYVFLRATILRQHNLEDLKYLSDQSAAAVDVPTGWPDVEPLVIGGRFAESAR